MKIGKIFIEGLDKYLRFNIAENFITKNDYVLDVGGGNGEFLNKIGARGIVLEYSEINENLNHDNNDVKIQYYNGETFPFNDNEFSAAVCLDTLEHIPKANRELIINEMIRVTKNKILIICPKRYLIQENLYWHISGFIQRLTKNYDFRRYYSEHKKFGIPLPHEVIDIINKNNSVSKVLSKSYISEKHQLIMLLQYILPILGFPLMNKIWSKLINFDSIEISENLYQMYIIEIT
ncbi:MAG: hypothetical protein HeimC2_18010 [Candidatus Heimdallarchaeota archaeon LC_2]|nr:MAG: hypothetical protein HeimC2_18010 [Candidatus Heimdallarchaeota archaeon LC_2]